VDLEQVLRSETRHSGSRRSRLIAESLVAAQVSLAVLVLSAAGLIARSLQRLESAELSFDSARLVIAPLAIRTDRFDTKDEQLALLTRVVDRVRAVPGVVAASPVVAVPFSVTAWDGRPSAEGQAREQAESNPMLNMELVGPDYFATLGIPVLRGRAFTSADRAGAPPVVVLSETAARHYWPNEDPIGKRVRMGPGLDQMLTVVGVVPNTRYRDLREARPSIYFPLHQSFFPFAPTTLAIRTAIDPVAAMPALQRAIDEVDPGVALSRIAPLESYLQGPLAQPRLNALLLAVFATTAVLLAAIGLFGVMMSTVRQRTREIGIRMALGATAHDLRRLVVRRGLVVTGVGVVAGLAGAIAANRFLGAMLYGVSPTDGWTLAFVGGILLVVAGAATAIPARSSTRIDPVVALRTDT